MNNVTSPHPPPPPTNTGLDLLSALVTFDKVSRHYDHWQRRETWSEVCDRYQTMMRDRFPFLADDIHRHMEMIRTKQVLPSMRALQFAGNAIRRKESRIYNCSYAPLIDWKAFAELYFIELGGSGIGYSVQKRHTEQLPPITGWSNEKRTVRIEDTVEGWADALLLLLESASGTSPEPEPVFDYSAIRPKGAPLRTTGGKAPGPDPLRRALDEVRLLLRGSIGRRLRPFECHLIMCHIAESVNAGGVRRTAMISFFDLDDEEMKTCKIKEGWRARYSCLERANNSAVVHLLDHTKEQFDALWEVMRHSPSGCPGIFFTNDYDVLCNPCGEASLIPFSFCNLTTSSARGVRTQGDFLARCATQAFFGTLQASFTDFAYLSSRWKTATETTALLGCSLTGVGLGTLDSIDVAEGARLIKANNQRLAHTIGIQSAARRCLIKPEGTTSPLLGVPFSLSGWWSRFYLRAINFQKSHPVIDYLRTHAPSLLEEKIVARMREDGTYYDTVDPDHPDILVTLPISVEHEMGVVRDEEPGLDMMRRVLRFYNEWILPSHSWGQNHHTVSCTIYLDDHEWDEAREWTWAHRLTVRALSFYPRYRGEHPQAPHRAISKDEYERRIALVPPDLDFSSIVEIDDETAPIDTVACAAGVCELV